MNERRARFEAVVMPYLDDAYRLARWLRPVGNAEDVVQEAMLLAYRGFGALRSADAKPWLLRIVRNVHLSALREQQRRELVPLPEEEGTRESVVSDSAADPEAEYLRAADERTLTKLIASLPEVHREVLVLRELEELGYREIAGIISVPVGTVMSRLARARAALRALWRQEEGGGLRGVR
jgi:RNA polymerase sigma-70 factor, ECF subfamily